MINGVQIEVVNAPEKVGTGTLGVAVDWEVESFDAYHSSGFVTSYVTAPGSGDHTGDLDVFAYEFTTQSYFFLDAVDVMAPSNTVVICAFGDSITDGTHSTLNGSDRWANALSRRLHDAYGNQVSIVNEAIAGNRVVNPVVANSTSGPAATDRLNRDVLGLSGLTDAIWLEGINDLGASTTVAAIEAGYQSIVATLHAHRIKVYGATMTSSLEGIVLHAFEGKAPFSPATLKQIRALKAVYGLDLTAKDAHQLREPTEHAK